MNLTVSDRLLISALFPREADMLTQITAKEVSEKVKLTPEERSAINLCVVPEGLKWDASKAIDKEVEFSKAEIAFLKAQVDRLDKERKIQLEMIDICQKIKSA